MTGQRLLPFGGTSQPVSAGSVDTAHQSESAAVCFGAVAAVHRHTTLGACAIGAARSDNDHDRPCRPFLVRVRCGKKRGIVSRVSSLIVARTSVRCCSCIFRSSAFSFPEMNDEQDKQKIREVIATWMRATSEGDFETVATLMAEDVVFLMPGQAPMHGRQAFMAASRGAVGKFRIDGKSDVQEIQIAGNLAFCWNHLTVTITPLNGNAPVRRVGNILSVFRKEADGRWVLYRDANMIATV